MVKARIAEIAKLTKVNRDLAVTHGNNRVLTHQQAYGSLERGFAPRFIMTQHNPLETAKNLACERWVVFDGTVKNSTTILLDNLQDAHLAAKHNKA